MKRKIQVGSLGIFAGLLMGSCRNEPQTTSTNVEQDALNEKKSEIMTETKTNEEIVNVALMYIKEGEEERFEEYKKKGGAILQKYGGRIERVVVPTMLAQGEMEELPSEIHFASYPSIEVFNQFNEDEEFIKIRNEYALPALKHIAIFTSKNTDFKFEKEEGDSSKTYGIALIYFNEGDQYEQMFAEYHDDVCKIMPEFGTHFERFIAPFQSGGNIDMEMPDEIHRFYFDSMEGLQQMGSDERMKLLFPKRDTSLKNLYFFIGNATL